MKYDVVIGNPPYHGVNHQQIYPRFYLWAKKNCKQMSMIFPSAWQDPKSGNGLKLMNTEDVKYDKQIVSIDNIVDGFKGVAGAKKTNIIYWKLGYDNGLNGEQLIYTDGKNPQTKKFEILKEDIKKPNEIVTLGKIVSEMSGFKSMKEEVSSRQAYKLSSDFIKNPSKSDMPEIFDKRKSVDDLKIYGIIDNKLVVKYVPKDYPLKRKWKGFEKFKVFTGSAWGNMSEKKYLGGAYGDIILAKPNELSTESFLENGCFDTIDKAKKHAKYILSKFTRALLYINKYDHHSSRGTWEAIPIQDYTEDFWNSDNIDDIDNGLFDKYNVPEDIRQFVKKNIQPKTVKDILGYDGKDISLIA